MVYIKIPVESDEYTLSVKNVGFYKSGFMD